MSNILLETIDRFTKKEIQPLLERIEQEEPNLVNNLFAGACEIGLNQLPLPEELGGAGLNPLLLGKILKMIAEISAGIASAFMFHYIAILPFLKNEKGINILKETISANRKFLSAPAFKLDGSSNVNIDKTEKWKINIWGLPPADHLVLYSESGPNANFTMIPANSESFHIENVQKKLGLNTCGLSIVTIKNIPLSETATLTLPINEGREILESTLSLLYMFVASLAIGNALGAAKHAIKYASERYQGGDIIINHSIIQTILGKALARIETLSAAVERFLQEAEKIGFKKAKLLKGVVTENCEWVCSDCVQVFGGYGYMKDFSVERHLRDAKTLAVIGGGNMFSFQEYVKFLKDEGYQQ